MNLGNPRGPFLPFISGLFVLAMVAIVYFVSGQSKYSLVFVCLFGCLGVYLLISSVICVFQLKSYNKLLKDDGAFVTDATFLSSRYYGMSKASSAFSPENNYCVEFERIKYSYKDGNGVVHFVKSFNFFTPSQVEYLKNKKEFKIKCRGSKNAIIEEIPPAKVIDMRQGIREKKD